MASVVVSLVFALRSAARSRAALHLEILALRHQVAVLNRSRPSRLRLTAADRVLWAWLSQAWSGWRPALVLVKPETVLAWHQRGFRLFWTSKSRSRTGRPAMAPEGCTTAMPHSRTSCPPSVRCRSTKCSRRRDRPWQNAYVERVIGSIRRECLDHVIVLSVAGLQRVLADYVEYYMNTRTHLSLGKDAPASRPATPISAGRIVEIPQVNGLHHRYNRAAA